jgi:hypothetical protein
MNKIKRVKRHKRKRQFGGNRDELVFSGRVFIVLSVSYGFSFILFIVLSVFYRFISPIYSLYCLSFTAFVLFYSLYCLSFTVLFHPFIHIIWYGNRDGHQYTLINTNNINKTWTSDKTNERRLKTTRKSFTTFNWKHEDKYIFILCNNFYENQLLNTVASLEYIFFLKNNVEHIF